MSASLSKEQLLLSLDTLAAACKRTLGGRIGISLAQIEAIRSFITSEECARQVSAQAPVEQLSLTQLAADAGFKLSSGSYWVNVIGTDENLRRFAAAVRGAPP